MNHKYYSFILNAMINVNSNVDIWCQIILVLFNHSTALHLYNFFDSTSAKMFAISVHNSCQQQYVMTARLYCIVLDRKLSHYHRWFRTCSRCSLSLLDISELSYLMSDLSYYYGKKGCCGIGIWMGKMLHCKYKGCSRCSWRTESLETFLASHFG